MLIEIHMIQNHSPSNLNRDDLGAPKTCLFGGVTRARISSQCLKRSIRRSEHFAAALERDGAVRTRRLVQEIAKAAADKGESPIETYSDKVKKAFEAGGVGFKDETTTAILFFLPQSAIEEMGAVVKESSENLGVKKSSENLGEKFATIIGTFAKTPDIALCGRMTEFDAKKHFKNLKGKFTVEAALSAAHAISTHAVVTEVDYFTAADDIPGPDAGAGHVNEAMFTSACFYKHFCIDWNQLLKNLGGDLELARKTVKCFIEAAAKATPSGKQHAYAAFNPPDGILVEVKTAQRTPMSYANAFAEPVPENSQRGLIGESIARLGQYVNEIASGYGIKADRFWFSPAKRYALTWVYRGEEGEANKEEPVVDGDHFTGGFDEFVTSVMAVVGKGAEVGAAS